MGKRGGRPRASSEERAVDTVERVMAGQTCETCAFSHRHLIMGTQLCLKSPHYNPDVTASWFVAEGFSCALWKSRAPPKDPKGITAGL